MGMWGIGIFDNDMALDYLDGLVDDFKQRINAGLGLEENETGAVAIKPIEQVTLADLDRVVLPSVAILVRLCGSGDVGSGPYGQPMVGSRLLERIEREAAGEELPLTGDSRLSDPITQWSAVPPVASVVQAWRDRSLEAFAAGVRAAQVSADYREGRPAIIRATFARLAALAAEYEQ